MRAWWSARPDGVRTWIETHWGHVLLAMPALGFALLVLRAGRGYHVANRLEDVALEHRSGADVPAQPCNGGQGNCLELGAFHLSREAVCVDGWFRSCVTAGPPSHGTLIVRVPGAPTSGTLELGGGVADDAWQRGDGAPITVRAFAGDTELGVLEIPNGRHWESAHWQLPGSGELRLEIDGGAPGRHDFCFDAIVR